MAEESDRPPSFMASSGTGDASTDTGAVRIARFDGEHPAGTPETGPIADLVCDLAASPGDDADDGADDDVAARRRRGRISGHSAGMSRRNLVLAGAVGVATATGAGGVVLRSLTRTDAPLPAAARLGDDPSPILGVPKAPAAVVPGGALALPKNLSTDLLVRRATYGATPGLLDEVDRTGPREWLTRQLDPAGLKDPRGDAVRRLFPTLGWSVLEVHERVSPGDGTVMADLGAAHAGRAMWSSRQLSEVLVDLWSNHFNVTCPHPSVWDTRHRYDAEVIRAHALGSFEDLLVASAVHPAMLGYLDGGDSAGSRPNENYARALLEHHTLGEGGFDERDVHRTALLFTGWRVQDGAAVYDLSRHFAGRLEILGFEHPNPSAAAGRDAQLAFLRYLARHPRTARTVARALAVRFVADSPPSALVERLAQVYTTGRTAILPMLRALFSAPELADSAGEKVRRPFERLAATVRALDVPVPDDAGVVRGLADRLAAAAHRPLAFPGAGGYPDVAAAWQSPAAALELLDATSGLVRRRRVLDDPPTERDDVIEAVARRVLGRAPSPAERSGARTLLAGTRLPERFRAGSPEQDDTVALAATLLLTSPAHLVR
jgi:uncharacterized protein (DUF1800 family)